MTSREPPAAAVGDANVAIKWVLPEIGSEEARALQGASLIAPDLLLAECANVLWKQARRNRITATEADLLYAELNRAPVVLVPITELIDQARGLAHALDHSIYDCLCIALAVSRDLPLVTDDRALIRAIDQHSQTRGRAVPLSALA